MNEHPGYDIGQVSVCVEFDEALSIDPGGIHPQRI